MIRLTRTGILYIGLTLFIGVAGINTGNNLIYFITAAFLGMLAVSGFFGRMNLRTLDVTVELPQEVFAGRPFPLRIGVRNGKSRFPALLVRVTCAGTARLIPVIQPGEEEKVFIDYTADRRGPHTLADVTVRSVFPFNFIARSFTITGESGMLVFPRPIRGGMDIREELLLSRQQERTADRKGSGSEFLTTRVYQRGDPYRHINWKATAKTDELRTKEFSSSVTSPVVIDFDRVAGSSTERRLSIMAQAVIDCTVRDVPVGLKLGGRLLPPASGRLHRIRLLKELALYGY